MAAVDVLSPKTRTWFERAFEAPTPAQELGWPAIARGGHVLIQAPTGSGKTLAGFLVSIDVFREIRVPFTGIRLATARRESPLAQVTAASAEAVDPPVGGGTPGAELR